MSILSELHPVEYDGCVYSSINHAYYSNITNYPDIKWYLINSTTEKEVDIIKNNFSFCFSKDEQERVNVLNKIISIRDRDPDFNKRIRTGEQPSEISNYLKSKVEVEDVFNWYWNQETNIKI